MTEYFIALDVHCAFSELAAMTGTGKLVRRDHCPTTIPALAEALKAVRRPRRLTFEEGPLADWLTRELRSHVDELVVCEPQRNHWIARDGDKDDPIDARKLADLYRGGYLKAVHQPGSLQRSLLKQHVSLYHDRVGGTRATGESVGRAVAFQEQVGIVALLRHRAGATSQRSGPDAHASFASRQSKTQEHSAGRGTVGDRPGGQPLCRQIPILDRGGRTGGSQRAAERGQKHRQHVVEPVENWRAVQFAIRGVGEPNSDIMNESDFL